MKKTPPAASPDDYVASLKGWRRTCVESLRAAVQAAFRSKGPPGEGPPVEQVKWGHLVYTSNGPAFLIRAEPDRVLFGFWRGQRLIDVEPRLKPGGKYEMATLELREGATISAATARRLVQRAVALNRELGEPTAVAKGAGKGSRQAATKSTTRKAGTRTAATRAKATKRGSG